MAEGIQVDPSIGVASRDIADREAWLVRQCAAGDEDASALLVAEHYRMVLKLAYHLLQNRNDAWDLAQEVFLQVFRTIHRFRGESALRTWITRITLNQVRNRHRWRRRHHQSDQISLDAHLHNQHDSALSFDWTPERVFANQELARRLGTAIAHLPFDQRTAIALREVEGMSYEEMAASLGIAIGTVKSRLTRARHALRRELSSIR